MEDNNDDHQNLGKLTERGSLHRVLYNHDHRNHRSHHCDHHDQHDHHHNEDHQDQQHHNFGRKYNLDLDKAVMAKVLERKDVFYFTTSEKRLTRS